jgi:signal transduction histidine kinase/DNA-binding response OmpR family regulator/HPt (histidine-containing phosphotransfer) domain-containing protein
VAAYSWQVNRELARDYQDVTHAYAVTRALESLMGRVTDGETAERGFLITGDDVYLEPYILFTSTIDQLYATLGGLLAGEPAQQPRMALLRTLLDGRKSELSSIIGLRRDSGLAAAHASPAFASGNAIHDRIGADVAAMSALEWDTIRRCNADVASATRESERAVGLGALAVAFLGLAILLLGWLERKSVATAAAAGQVAELEKARLQAELARNFELLGRVGEIAKMGGWEVDAVTKRLNFSRELFRIYEMEPGVAPDLDRALDNYPPDARALIGATVEAACINGGCWDLELPFITSKGRHIWVRTIGQAVVKAGVIVKLEGSLQDITERKFADESMRYMNEQLVASRDSAEAANKAKGQFLANMSHEIRTPMNAVLGMLQLLGQTELAQRQHDYVDKAHTAAKSLLGILNDILDFSKIDSGKMELDIRSFSFDGVMRYLAVLLSTTIGDKDIEAILDVDARLPLDIRGDSLRLQQVLINLISNAAKFTEQGEIVVTLRMIGSDDAGVDIEFSVRDSGIGIVPGQIEHLFRSFSQAETSTARRFGGTGLGLAISRRLVALMGGDLQVQSEAGKGSRFFFQLRFESTEKPGVLQDRYAALSLPGAAANPALRVLVVDDNESAREVLKSMVEALGWQCDALSSGAQALAAMARSSELGQRYDVVFMDWKMPGMDGWQTTQHIRDTYRTETVPIIIMISAFGREAMVERLQGDPAVLDGFLTKPITTSMLFDAVVDARAGGTSAAATARQRRVSTRLAGLRLLVVEDNQINQQIAYELLTNEGAHVTVASSGRLGVAAALSASPAFDAVLMDIQMPDVDGYAATAEIRRHDSMQALPIIATTASVMSEDREACLAAGMNDHIAKPIDLETLVKTILRHCAAVSGVDQDFEGALRQLGGNKSLLRKMAGMFIQSVATLPAELQRHLAGERKPEAMRLLHSLRGDAGSMGLKPLALHTLRLEQQLRPAASIQSLMPSVDQLDVLLQDSCETLQAYVDTLKGGTEALLSAAEQAI